MMTQSSNSLCSLGKKLTMAIGLFYLCTIPVFYVALHLELSGLFYMTVRIARFLVIAVITYVVCRRNQEEFSRHMSKRSVAIAFPWLICAGLFLGLDDLYPKLYFTVSSSIGIYDQNAAPLFVALLWEQIFSGDLFWSTVLCVSITLGFLITREKG